MATAPDRGETPTHSSWKPQRHPPPCLPRLQGLLTLFAKSFASFVTLLVLYRSHVCVLPCNGYTLHFKLQSQATLLLDVASIALGDHLHNLAAYGAIALCCEPFQGTSWCARWPEGMPATPQPTVYAGITTVADALWGKVGRPCGAHATSAWRQRLPGPFSEGPGSRRVTSGRALCCQFNRLY